MGAATAQCTICAAEPSSGFYTGCLIADGHGDGKWLCDGKGNLTRPDQMQTREQMLIGLAALPSQERGK